jgi:hypothetical protein
MELKPCHYKWWDKRIREPIPLNNDEATVVDNCGGLYYLYKQGLLLGFDAIANLEVYDSHHSKCHSESICKTGRDPENVVFF